MSINMTLPADFERQSAPFRARAWAAAYRRLAEPNYHLIALLEELATEVDLGQRTQLTYRGDALPEPKRGRTRRATD